MLRSKTLVRITAFGAVAAGAAMIEVALLPGILVGGAVILAPKYLPKHMKKQRFVGLADIRLPNALAKTVTFRVISTGFDFGWNYIILGEAVTAAGLSGISLVVAPLIYLLHESGWNLYHSAARDTRKQPPAGVSGLKQTATKTITFRAVATAAEFGTNYAFVRDIRTAAALSAFGFFVGPMVYYGHEKLWERYGPAQTVEPDGGNIALANPA